MKYISAEQFLKADQEVRDSIMKWWKPEIGDLFSWIRQINDIINCKMSHSYSLQMMDNDCKSEYDNGNFDCTTYRKCEGDFYIPLLTTQQLIDYIEDKIGFKFNIISFLNKWDVIAGTHESIKDDLVEALWEVAQEISK